MHLLNMNISIITFKINNLSLSSSVSKSTFIAAISIILTLSGLKLMEVHSKSKNTTSLLSHINYYLIKDNKKVRNSLTL